MRKTIYTLIALFIFTVTISAQSRYTFIDFKDSKKTGVQNEFFYSDKTVNSAIDDKMTRMGYKSRDVNGYAMYKSVLLPELGNQTYDLYFKVDRKSRKEKDNAIVTLLVSSGNENFISDSSDSKTMNNARNYLDNLTPVITAYDLQQQVNAQQDVVTKAYKKYKSLQDDGDDLQKKRKKLEQQIEDNIKAQKEQQAEIERQRQLFETIKSRQR